MIASVTQRATCTLQTSVPPRTAPYHHFIRRDRTVLLVLSYIISAAHKFRYNYDPQLPGVPTCKPPTVPKL